ncbi:MAG: VOC family protein [Opitutaceae bacterium]
MNEKNLASLIRDFAFCVLSVSDMARSRAFYTGVLGLKETANWSDRWVEYDIGHGTLAVTVESTEMPVGGSGVMVALEMADLQEAQAILKTKGVAPIGDPWDSPACLGLLLRDPDGYSILLHQIKPARPAN